MAITVTDITTPNSPYFINEVNLTVLIATDHSDLFEVAPRDLQFAKKILSGGVGQSAALNAAASRISRGFIAFLEDDDTWMPEFLRVALESCSEFDFVSSTQLEVNSDGEVLRINDFPTPSGWFMPVSLFYKVGFFCEDFRFHLDNEWLGRLSLTGATRVHLVEATAPITGAHASKVRPWLYNVLTSSGGRCKLKRHSSPYPLVKRLVHDQSGMTNISNNRESNDCSKFEIKALLERYGRIPW